MKIQKIFHSSRRVFTRQQLPLLAQQQQLEPSADRLKKDVSYLASDELDGRRTGTAGANEAARYIAGEFSKIGPASRGVCRELSAIVSLRGRC